ncbi:MAG: CPBP family intramembrane metalloprotease [Bacteroidetes bacterium]|nr:CPBP family intramembrane metalloprotease [Bacteroidota bacterium]MBU1679863.1 CPBP family intramembrane metalloprotease [Bacteroidota bacterium]MBU2507565.1 CPBP family intramembrane metalloprotease [Bacteroidota bacterium]
MPTILKNEIKDALEKLKSLDKRVVIIFISVAVLQTISWYFTSRRFFRYNLYYTVFEFWPDKDLIEFIYWFVGDFFTLFILPVLIIKFYFKEQISSFGISIGDFKAGLKISGVFIAIMLPVVLLISQLPEFSKSYPHLQAAKSDWQVFIVYELFLLLYLIAWEFIWRGYMLFGLEKQFGFYAVFIQMIPFVILHNGKPFLETFSAIFGGIALGILALRTRSILYPLIVHFIAIFSLDLLSTIF